METTKRNMYRVAGVPGGGFRVLTYIHGRWYLHKEYLTHQHNEALNERDRMNKAYKAGEIG